MVQHEQQVQKRPLLAEQLKHLEPPLTLAPAGKPVAHFNEPDQALSPVFETRKSGPQSELPTQLEPENSEPKLVDTHLEKTEISASLPESPVILRKPVDPGSVEPGMPAETVRSTDKTSSEAEISPDAYIRKESDAAVQRLPLTPVDLVLPTRNEFREVKPDISHVINSSTEKPEAPRVVNPQAEKPDTPDMANPPVEKPEAPRVINQPPSKISDPAQMEGIQRKVETFHPRQPEKQELSQPTMGETSQSLVQRKTSAEPATLKPSSRELPQTHPVPTELVEPQNLEPLEIPDIATVDGTPKPARSMPVQETPVDPLVLRRLAKDASREPEQSAASMSPES